MKKEKRSFVSGWLLVLLLCLYSCSNHEKEPLSASEVPFTFKFEAEVDGLAVDEDSNPESQLRTLPITRKDNKMYYPFIEGDEVKITLVFLHHMGSMGKKVTYQDIPFVYSGGKLRAKKDITLPMMSGFDWRPDYHNVYVAGYINIAQNMYPDNWENQASPLSSGWKETRMRWGESGSSFVLTPRINTSNTPIYAAYYMDWEKIDMAAVRNSGQQQTAIQKLKFKPNGVIFRVSFENTSLNPFTINSFTLSCPYICKGVDAVTRYSMQNPRIQWEKVGTPPESYNFTLANPLTLVKQASEASYWVWFGTHGNGLVTGDYPITLTINGTGTQGAKTSYTLQKTIKGPKGNITHKTIPIKVKFAAEGTPAPLVPSVPGGGETILPIQFLTESSLDASTRTNTNAEYYFYPTETFKIANEYSLLNPGDATRQYATYSYRGNMYFLPDIWDWLAVMPVSVRSNSMVSLDGDLLADYQSGDIFFYRATGGIWRRPERVRIRQPRATNERPHEGELITFEAEYSLSTRNQDNGGDKVYALRFKGGKHGEYNKYFSAYRYTHTNGGGIKIEAVLLGPSSNVMLSDIWHDSWWTQQHNQNKVIERYLAVGGNTRVGGASDRDGRFVCKNQDASDYECYFQFDDNNVWIQKRQQSNNHNAGAQVRLFKSNPKGQDTRTF